MMRISPVGYMFNTPDLVKTNARLATIPSHNFPEALDYAIIISLIIYYARQGLSKKEIITKLNIYFHPPILTKLNTTC